MFKWLYDFLNKENKNKKEKDIIKVKERWGLTYGTFGEPLWFFENKNGDVKFFKKKKHMIKFGEGTLKEEYIIGEY